MLLSGAFGTRTSLTPRGITYDPKRAQIVGNMNTYQSLRHLYWESTGPTRFTTVLLYPFAAFGLMRAYQLEDPSTDWMFHLVSGVPESCHALAWGLLVAYVFCARVLGLWVFNGYRWTLRTTPLLGCAFWLALLTSNVVDTERLAFGLLYGVAAALEAWILSRNWQETQ